MRFDASAPPSGTIRDWIDTRADETPDAISHVFTDNDAVLCWHDLRESVRGIAQALAGLGIEKGGTVGLCQPNGYNAVLCLFGILYGGFRALPFNLAAGAKAMGHAISHSKCSHVFVDKTQTEVFNAGLAQSDARPVIIPVNNTINLPAPRADLPPIAPHDHALLMYTSGTTGLPKGVVHSQTSLLSGGWTTAIAHGLTPKDRAMCILPFFHINGLCVTLIAPLISGGSVCLAPRFSASSFWAECARHKISWFSAVPTIISHLLHDTREPMDAGIRFARSASAPLAPETQRGFEDRFGIIIIETMGLTETAGQILSNPMPPMARKIGSAGMAFGNEIAVLDKTGRVLNADTVGEIAVRGANVLVEYLDNKQAMEESFTPDGWLRTGDLGYCDADGYVFITGRLKELIIKGGENIAPREIDDVLYSHKDVLEAGAFALPCPRYGQRVLAAVCLTPGSQATKAELLDLCRGELGAFKCPDDIYFMQELPKGPSGKIQRLKIAELVRGL